MAMGQAAGALKEEMKTSNGPAAESGRGEEAASAMQHEGNARPAIPLAEAAE